MYVTTSCPYFDLSFVSSDIRSVRTFKISNSTVHDHVHARKFSIVNPGHGSDRIRNGRNRKYEKGDMLITSLKLHNKSRIITWNKLVQVLLLISSYCFGLNYLKNFAGFTTNFAMRLYFCLGRTTETLSLHSKNESYYKFVFIYLIA
jgi:hypothetical protein